MLITPATIGLVIGAGAVAGCLGALLGIGGGVFLVPFLQFVVGLPLNVASGVGLMTVIATSSVVSAGSAGRRLVNLRLGMLMQVAASASALAAAVFVVRIPERTLYLLFAAVTAAIGLLMLARLERRNVILDASLDAGPFGGRFYEEESGREVVYRTRRVPAGVAVSLVAGFVSGSLGIGGGILQVPALNAWCGVPLRVAAATSAVMIGITAVSSAPIYYSRGLISPALAAAAVLGVLIGSRAGFWFGGRARAKWLKLLMAAVLAFVSVAYLVKTIE
ncbi:MAG TPA: sulfite exporter TauE/SafE family protein [Vicinamibacterales bacterium]|nr:sulfite exporter TauE/SafE family protein [Vicinamibacterales bacterium]